MPVLPNGVLVDTIEGNNLIGVSKEHWAELMGFFKATADWVMAAKGCLEAQQ